MAIEEKKILIVDDDRDFRESLCDILEIEGYKTYTAHTKIEGMEILKAHMPQIALVDLHLGQSNGFEVIQDFKQYNSDLICLVVTAHVDVDSAIEAVKYGAYDYLRKPLSGDELIAAMDRCFKFLNLEIGNKIAKKSLMEKNNELEDINSRLKQTVVSSTRFNEYNEVSELQYAIREEFQRLFPHCSVTFFIADKENDKRLIKITETNDAVKLSFSIEDCSFCKDWDQSSSLLDNRFDGNKKPVPLLNISDGSVMFVPLSGGKNKHLGFLCIHAEDVDYFTRSDVDLANILSSVSSSSLRSMITNEELKVSEFKFRQSQKLEALGRLAGGIAHDFNNLLSAINGYAELLLMDLKEQEDAKIKIKEIRQVVRQGSSLISQLLMFSRSDNTANSIIELNTLLNDSVKILTILLGVDYSLELDLIYEPCFVLGNADKLKQVLINLVVNSRDAMEGYGNKLTISTKLKTLNFEDFPPHFKGSEGVYIELKVSDNGCGMDKETLTHIFDPFFTTKETGKGTGLGLSTVFGIINQANGFISAESQKENGSDFFIYLPFAQSKSQMNKKDKEQKASSCELNYNVLLVEDDNIVRNVISESLRRRGVAVTGAENGRQALHTFKNRDKCYDLVITDIIMPLMRGDKFAEEVLRIKSDQKMIYMSGFTNENLFANNALNVSEKNYLRKPFSNDVLINMIQNVMEN
jgi:signal transduction histidine kinase/DNA-binding response OmpR family regulator